MGSLTLKQFRSPLLEPIDLQVSAGECITLSGPSGSGKSRLLRALADLDPHQGEAWFDDKEMNAFSAPAWRREVGLLPAESAWWRERVGDHFPRSDPELMDRLDLSADAMQWEISRLSSGERQRLALVRLLCNRPGVLLLDEPTANLDQKNIDRVEGVLRQWRRDNNTAVLWVTHDPEQQRRVGDRMWHIADGRLQVKR
ncbi:MAG: ATP-binding protein [gamma proteobacterium symbiont of Ctena orbiculata]|uniref:ATP-binding cassette domain-containing protein n=1 Tax=Candidatus Thiodiazotropha taylori TaxID=2792791 RepID=A0A944MBI1_9GAMM|nr:ATP-binding cassette domain-containing protein [Candidatus Thiodiazotropha taylori]PUB85515.1 MAG: ATP-binding protein [gamma proteobacterium symbiont of Ctena orbiculata]MBT2990936.1 ATP-binding cassette domain-containing protein [Candidatus Thiodiazotropha taylori]MBT2998683.1 ATP-binding cassette domain-containing protein [Candidatus Thiodiazotropha taylori]MBT3002797.1 ATP-binding cassette domain-containing protein [Candidatus Thiodiazotropha taylori]